MLIVQILIADWLGFAISSRSFLFRNVVLNTDLSPLLAFISICVVIAIFGLCYAQHSLKTYVWKSEIFISPLF